MRKATEWRRDKSSQTEQTNVDVVLSESVVPTSKTRLLDTDQSLRLEEGCKGTPGKQSSLLLLPRLCGRATRLSS
jgi:hypothetical protein